jgi:hypothetical protein
MSRFTRIAGGLLMSAVVATACSSSSSSTTTTTPGTGGTTAPAAPTAAPAGHALPADGCTLLTSAEVTTFLGSTPPCTSKHTGGGDPQSVGRDLAGKATNTGPSLEAAVERNNGPLDKSAFEEDAGTKSNAGAKVVTGIGDDAVLIRQPHSDTSGAIWILAGDDEYQVVVTRGSASGATLANALTTVGRRLLGTYR